MWLSWSCPYRNLRVRTPDDLATAQLEDNLAAVRPRIAEACTAAGRPPIAVRLLAVSKAFGPDGIHAAGAAGQTHFGENYFQEAVGKIAHFRR